jgi:hypothetical protein
LLMPTPQPVAGSGQVHGVSIRRAGLLFST